MQTIFRQVVIYCQIYHYLQICLYNDIYSILDILSPFIFTVLTCQRYYHCMQVCIWSFTIIEDSILEIAIGNYNNDISDNENKEGRNLNISSQYNIKNATQKGASLQKI